MALVLTSQRYSDNVVATRTRKAFRTMNSLLISAAAPTVAGIPVTGAPLLIALIGLTIAGMAVLTRSPGVEHANDLDLPDTDSGDPAPRSVGVLPVVQRAAA